MKRRVVVATPAGRQPTMDILRKWLEAAREAVDEWHLWFNPNTKDSAEYVRSLAGSSDPSYVKLINVLDSIRSNARKCFYSDGCDPETTYIKLDDDIVYAPVGSIRALAEAAESAPDDILVSGGNVINNAACSRLHQQNGALGVNQGSVGPSCIDELGWRSPEFCEFVHRSFLASVGTGDTAKYDFGIHVFGPMWWSINAIAWKGEVLREVLMDNAFFPQMNKADENALTEDIPATLEMHTQLVGSAIFAHYSFYPQKKHLDTTDILSQYAKLAP